MSIAQAENASAIDAFFTAHSRFLLFRTRRQQTEISVLSHLQCAKVLKKTIAFRLPGARQPNGTEFRPLAQDLRRVDSSKGTAFAPLWSTELSNLLPCVPKPLIEGVPQTAFEDTSDFEAGTRHQVDELSWTQFL